MVGPAETTAALKASVEIAKLVQREGLWTRIRTALKEKRHVLVLGSTGTGKTNFLESLRQETMPRPIHHLDRTVASPEDVKLVVSGSPFVFHDTPGQEGYRSDRSKAMVDALRHKHLGIINVVSYGYHEYAVGKAEAAAKKASERAAFLERHRAVEITALREWVDLLAGPGGPRWLMTVVTKADLWWDHQDEVLDYYRSGAYHQALGEFKDAGPVVVHYCSVFHKFFSEVRMAGTFEEVDRLEAKAHFLKRLVEVSSR